MNYPYNLYDREKPDKTRFVLWGLAAVAALFAAQNLPDLVRYLKIRSM